jgi:predicted SprT family Zn-dependent metalloprotease
MRYVLVNLYLQYLFWTHGLSNWTYGFRDLHTSGGLTFPERKKIMFSRQAIERLGFYDLRDLLLHEVAHALVPEGKPHSTEWKEMHLRLGGSGEVSCKDFSVESDYRWTKSCSKCRYEQLCHRRYGIWCDTCGSAVSYIRASLGSQQLR